MDLAEQKCVACEGGMPPLNKHEAEVLLKQVPGWTAAPDGKTLTRQYQFKNFKEALAFVNKVGEIAESEGHHPNLHLTDYRKLQIDLTTHAIGGLSNNDFILAAKINAL